MAPDEQVSALWTSHPHTHTSLLAPLQAVCKVQSRGLNIAQFTLVFWSHFPFVRKPHPGLNE